MVEHDVKNLSLAPEGRLKIEWAEQSMPSSGTSASASRTSSP